MEHAGDAGMRPAHDYPSQSGRAVVRDFVSPVKTVFSAASQSRALADGPPVLRPGVLVCKARFGARFGVALRRRRDRQRQLGICGAPIAASSAREPGRRGASKVPCRADPDPDGVVLQGLRHQQLCDRHAKRRLKAVTLREQRRRDQID